MSKPVPNLYPRKSSSGDDNMVPLINIVFLLLIFFMVAGKIQVDHAKNIELPFAQPQAPATMHEINVVLDVEGQVTLNGKPVADLAMELDTLLAGNARLEVALMADARLQARQLVPVMNVIRAAGVEKIRLFARAGVST